MMTKFSIGDVDKPTQATIVKGFHKYTSAAILPEKKSPASSIRLLDKSC